jgi:hypothetical protein
MMFRCSIICGAKNGLQFHNLQDKLLMPKKKEFS